MSVSVDLLLRRRVLSFVLLFPGNRRLGLARFGLGVQASQRVNRTSLWDLQGLLGMNVLHLAGRFGGCVARWVVDEGIFKGPRGSLSDCNF